jgi:hypothetical protein
MHPACPREQVARQPLSPPQLRMHTSNPALHSSSQSASATVANMLAAANVPNIRNIHRLLSLAMPDRIARRRYVKDQD